MKKIISLLLAVLMLAAVLTACGKGAGGKSDESENTEKTETTVEKEDKEDETSAETTEETTAAKAEMANPYVFDAITIDMPAGFTVDDSSSTVIAYPPEYPTKTDNITFVSTVADKAENYSQSYFDNYYSESFQGFSGSSGFEQLKIDGEDAIKYTYGLSVSGIDMNQTQVYLFLKDSSIIITFTNVSGDYSAQFDACINSIIVND